MFKNKLHEYFNKNCLAFGTTDRIAYSDILGLFSFSERIEGEVLKLW
jgi:hypothetical protein